MSAHDYRIVRPDWARDERGPASDVIAVEHVHDHGLCLVDSTTLSYSLAELSAACLEHDRICEFATTGVPNTIRACMPPLCLRPEGHEGMHTNIAREVPE